MTAMTVKKAIKLKKYVLTVSEKFPKTHPRSGHDTEFANKILDRTKIHTIRGNYPFWSKRIDAINRGEAILSIRQWTGKPYNSPQIEIHTLYRGQVEYQPIKINRMEKDIE